MYITMIFDYCFVSSHCENWFCFGRIFVQTASNVNGLQTNIKTFYLTHISEIGQLRCHPLIINAIYIFLNCHSGSGNLHIASNKENNCRKRDLIFNLRLMINTIGLMAIVYWTQFVDFWYPNGFPILNYATYCEQWK